MKTLVRRIALAATLLCVPIAHADDLTPEKDKDVRALLTEVGVIESTRDSFTRAMGAIDIYRGCPECPPNAQEIMTRVAADTISSGISGPGGLTDQLVPIYARHFTHDEIKQWLVFLRSPVGRKVVSEQAALVPDVDRISSNWVKSLVPVINEKARKEMGVMP